MKKRSEPLVKSEDCYHYWIFSNKLWEGRRGNEIAVVKYCIMCEKVVSAYAHRWSPVPTKNTEMHDWAQSSIATWRKSIGKSGQGLTSNMQQRQNALDAGKHLKRIVK